MALDDKVLRRIAYEEEEKRGIYYTGDERFDKVFIEKWQPLRRYKLGLFNKNRRKDGVYSEEEIKKDLELVKKIKSSPEYKVERSEGVIVFEHLAMEGIHEGLWFGDDASVIPTTEYDDLVNGVDFVVVFYDDEGEFYLGVDATTGQEKRVIDYKLGKVVDKLEHNKLFEVKYFYNEDTGVKGRIELPLVVIGAYWDDVIDLKSRFLENRRQAQETERIQLDFLLQAMGQLKAELEYLIRTNVPDKQDFRVRVELEQNKSKQGESDEKRSDVDDWQEMLEILEKVINDNFNVIKQQGLDEIFLVYLKPLERLVSAYKYTRKEKEKSPDKPLGCDGFRKFLKPLYDPNF